MITEKVNLMAKLASFVKLKRKQKGWTQTQTAVNIGMTGTGGKQYISDLERNALDGMNISTLENLLSVLDCGISFIDRSEV